MFPPQTRYALYLLVLFLGALACSVVPPPLVSQEEGAAGPPPAAAEEFQSGFVLGLFRKDSHYYLRREYVQELRELRELGCDSVTIVVRRFMDTGTSTEIYAHDHETVPDRRLEAVLAEAARQGFRITLFPYVLLEHPREDEWRGNIKPTDWEKWFASYRENIEHYARMAEAAGVQYFCVGSELASTEWHETAWRKVIAGVRQVYSGKIFYAANWDHYQALRFLDATDYAAINAYNRLVDEPTTDVAVLSAAWRKIRADLLGWSRKHRLPLLLTEVGYASVEGCSVDPWDYTRTGKVAVEEQAACLRAFTDTWSGVPDLAGVHFYIWWGAGGETDTGYTPRGKPAERVIRRYFARQAAAGR